MIKRIANHVIKRKDKALEGVLPGYKLHKWIREHGNDGIETLMIENSSICNLKCEYCNFHGREDLIKKGGREALMSWEVANTIADQIKEYQGKRILGFTKQNN